ncbi:TonB family protein [Elusimicrobiota bacterium]
MIDSRRIYICWIYSFAIHMAIFGMYMLFRSQQEANLKILSEVEFIEPESIVKREDPIPESRIQKLPKNTWEFIKMALPSFSKPKLQEAEAPKAEQQLKMAEMEKIDLKKGLKGSAPEIALNKRMDGAKAIKETDFARTQTAAKPDSSMLESPLDLEEVGKVKVKIPEFAPKTRLNLNKDIDAKRLQRATLNRPAITRRTQQSSSLQGSSIALSTVSYKSAEADAALQKIKPIAPAKIKKEEPKTFVASSKVDLSDLSKKRKLDKTTLELTPKTSSKAVEISGPISARKILKRELPQYPDWAKEQLINASVAFRFHVSSDGRVKEKIATVRTSGFNKLDKLARDALREWLFSPTSAQDQGRDEWGIITFNFKLQ